MDVEQKADNVAPENAGDAAGQESNVVADADNVASEGKVDYSSYRRQVSKTRNLSEALEKERAEKQNLLQDKLANEGKKDELITNLQEQVNEWRGKATKAVSSFADGKVREAAIAEAAKLGCQDPDILIKAYNEDLKSIDFDDQFNPDRDQLVMQINKWKGERPYLFNKPAPEIGNHQIKTDAARDAKPQSISSLKDEQLMDLWAKADKK